LVSEYKKGEVNMVREIIRPAGGVALNVPLSPAVKANGVVYCSGQLPLAPETGELISGDIKLQTRQVLTNLATVLKAAGSDLNKTLKVTIYMTDLSGFSDMNQVYKEFFPTEPPARTTVGISGLARAGCLIEIDLIALSA
jgi:2-iminobutanoate/2-iminopropanoate deaminase